jgi:hypothetical protein
MLTRLLASLLCLGAAAAAAPSLSAQSDLDAFMEKVLARRDDNWKKLQQYVLEEKEAFDLTGPGGFPLFGMRREYAWFIRQGVFVRSPVRANGVELSESDRRKAEDDWLNRQRRREEREKRRAEREANGLPPEKEGTSVAITPTDIKVDRGDQGGNPAAPSNVEDVLRQGMEPQFVSSAYFLKFKFESGHYALAGRETIGDVPALKIEYYPEAGLFKDGRTKPDKRVRDREDEIESKMNKASMVTLWIDPKTHQILQYTFDDLDWDFFPGRALVRIGDVQAIMQMGQAFPNIWLPKSIEMRFEMTLAVGTVDATYRVDYLNYKEAAVTYKIK